MIAAFLDTNGLSLATLRSAVLELVRNKLIQAGKTAGAGGTCDCNANALKLHHLSALR
jgi:hypothetical protein